MRAGRCSSSPSTATSSFRNRNGALVHISTSRTGPTAVAAMPGGDLARSGADRGWDSADSVSVRLAAIVDLATFNADLETINQCVAEFSPGSGTAEWISLTWGDA